MHIVGCADWGLRFADLAVCPLHSEFVHCSSVFPALPLLCDALPLVPGGGLGLRGQGAYQHPHPDCVRVLSRWPSSLASAGPVLLSSLRSCFLWVRWVVSVILKVSCSFGSYHNCWQVCGIGAGTGVACSAGWNRTQASWAVGQPGCSISRAKSRCPLSEDRSCSSVGGGIRHPLPAWGLCCDSVLGISCLAGCPGQEGGLLSVPMGSATFSLRVWSTQH